MIGASPRSELPFAALLAYSPRGQSETSRHSRDVTRWIKQNLVIDVPGIGRVPATRYFAGRLAEELARSPFPRWFDGAILVPVPRSAPLSKGALWPAFQLAAEMMARGIGREVVPCLERKVAVPKSAFRAAGERPSVQRHRDSLVVDGEASLGTRRVVLVDDVVTKGATLLAAAQVLGRVWTRAEIVGFAAIRTLGLQPEIGAILDPCVGAIRAEGNSLQREP